MDEDIEAGGGDDRRNAAQRSAGQTGHLSVSQASQSRRGDDLNVVDGKKDEDDSAFTELRLEGKVIRRIPRERTHASERRQPPPPHVQTGHEEKKAGEADGRSTLRLTSMSSAIEDFAEPKTPPTPSRSLPNRELAPLELKGSSVRSMQTSMAVMEDRLGHTDEAVAQLEGRVAKMEQQINGVLETQPLRAESVHEAMEP